MITIDPFHRIAVSASAASEVKIYSKEEAQAMMERGQVSRIGEIHQTSHGSRSSVPDRYGRGSYGFGLGMR